MKTLTAIAVAVAVLLTAAAPAHAGTRTPYKPAPPAAEKPHRGPA